MSNMIWSGVKANGVITNFGVVIRFVWSSAGDAEAFVARNICSDAKTPRRNKTQ